MEIKNITKALLEIVEVDKKIFYKRERETIKAKAYWYQYRYGWGWDFVTLADEKILENKYQEFIKKRRE